MRASRWRRSVAAASAACLLLLSACDDGGTERATTSRPPPTVTGSWTVELLSEDALGDGWTSRDLPDPAAGLVDGLCGVPDVLEHFPPSQVVRYERDAVVTHALVETDDAPGLAAVLATELELCQQEDDRVTAARRVDLEVAAPPTDAFELHASIELVDAATEAVWAITTVDERYVSVVGASVTELFEDPGDPFELVVTSVEAVYHGENGG